MFITPFAQKYLSAFVAGCFIAAGILTFGKALIFDRLYIVVLVTLALFARKNINILGVIAILTFQRALEESVWLSLEHFSDIKWFIYVASLSLLFLDKNEPCYPYFSITLFACLLAELLWNLNDYKAPVIFWHLFNITNALLTRKLLLLRPSITAEVISKSAETIRLDHYIYNIIALYIWVNIFMIFEYLVRHIMSMKEILFIYYSYPYLTHAIVVLALYNLTDQTIKEQNRKSFKF